MLALACRRHGRRFSSLREATPTVIGYQEILQLVVEEII
jgi:hypothetical protein